jgi:hypothetical protein
MCSVSSQGAIAPVLARSFNRFRGRTDCRLLTVQLCTQILGSLTTYVSLDHSLISGSNGGRSWLRLGMSHIRCLLPGRRERIYYFNSSVGQETRTFGQFNAFCGHKCDADTFGQVSVESCHGLRERVNDHIRHLGAKSALW